MADSMANKKRHDYARLITGRNRDDSFYPMIYEAFGAAQPKVKEGLSELFDDVNERLGWASAQQFHREFLRATGDAVQQGMSYVLNSGVLAAKLARRQPFARPGPGRQ